MPVLQTVHLENFLVSGEVAVELPLGAKVHSVRVVQPPPSKTPLAPSVVAVVEFEISTKLTCTRTFVAVEDGQPYIEQLDYVGSLHFVDKKGFKFLHVCVEKDKPAITLTGGR